jgi:hypothetical protein
MNDEKGEKARRLTEEVRYLSKELRYTQQTVASELAGWQNMHERMGRRAIREFARGMVVQERARMDGLMRALRKVRATDGQQPVATEVGAEMADGMEDAKVS